jgi:hypothetical protein
MKKVIRSFSSSQSAKHREFLKNVAKVEIPVKLDELLQILSIQKFELVDPTQRRGINPFVIPLAKNKKDGSFIGFLRWPTQKETMPMQVVRTNPVGLTLLALSADAYCHRQAVELDFSGDINASTVLELAGPLEKKYEMGDALKFVKTAKLPQVSEENKLRLGLDRFILTKVAPFPDCYERLATDYIRIGNFVNGLVTIERAASLFFSWGAPAGFHARLLTRIGRPNEAKDVAKAALSDPKFTLCKTDEVTVICLLFL